MTELKVINQNGQLLVDSREVAEMTKVRHADLLEKIDSYIQFLENGKIRSQDFFVESSYKTEGNNKIYKCFLLTRKGCDMVANKMTGEKGVLFTAAYVIRFEEMEKELTQPKTQLEVLQCTINQLVEQERRISDVELRLVETQKKQDNITEIISLNPVEWRKKVNAIINKIANALGGFQAYQDIRNESYQHLEGRAGCNLSTRLTNKKRKMALEGVAKSKIDKVNKMDVIADDARLTEIYLAIIKEMAIRHQVDLKSIS